MNHGFSLFVDLFSFNQHKFYISVWRWQGIGLIDLSLCISGFEWKITSIVITFDSEVHADMFT